MNTNRQAGPEHDRLLRELGQTVLDLRTERDQLKQAEARLAKLLLLLQAHTDNAPMAVIEFDAHYRIVNWSTGAERMFGWKADEVGGKAIGEFRWVVEDDQEAVKQLSERMSRQGWSSNVNINRNYRNDGGILTCAWHNSSISGADGTMNSVLSFVQDVSSQVAAERELRESQARLDLALQAADLGAWELDQRTGQMLITARWAEILGYQLEELTPFSYRQLLEWLHPDDRDPILKAGEWSGIGSNDQMTVEVRVRHREGQWIWARVHVRVIDYDNAGKPLRVVGTLEDFTDEKTRSIEREQLINDLREALGNVNTLRGLIPICSSCKKVRNDQGFWSQVEEYVAQHSEATFSHSLCPECMHRDFPDIYRKLHG